MSFHTLQMVKNKKHAPWNYFWNRAQYTGIFSLSPASTLSPSPIPCLSLSIVQCPARQSPPTLSSSRNMPAILAPSLLPSPGQCSLSLSLPDTTRYFPSLNLSLSHKNLLISHGNLSPSLVGISIFENLFKTKIPSSWRYLNKFFCYRPDKRYEKQNKQSKIVKFPTHQA